MKVVYVVSLFPCWSETFITREIHCLLEAGVDVRIVSLKHPCEEMVQSDARTLLDRAMYPRPRLAGSLAAAGEVLRRPGLALRELVRMTTALATEPAKLAKSVVTWWRALALVGPVRALGADRLHAHWATYPTTAAQVLAPRVGLPYSFTCHAHDIFVERQFIGAKLQEAEFGVTISRFNVGFLAERVGPVARQKLTVVHCGVVPAQIPYTPFDAAAREPGLIVSVGRLDAIKGFETLVDACAQLLAQGRKFRCVLVGEGPLRAALASRVAAAGLGEHFEMPGAMPGEAVRDLLARARLFVLPSRVTPAGDRDGIPVALMEAMASGTPVVSTTVSGIPELIDNGQHGLLVAPDEAPALAAAIASQLDDPAQAAAMAQTARARVASEFDVATETARLLQAFEAGRPLARTPGRDAPRSEVAAVGTAGSATGATR